MASQASLDIVNALFAGQKDLSDYVDGAMQDKALETITARKSEIGNKIFTALAQDEEPPRPEEEVADTLATPEASTATEASDETDNGTNN